MIKKKSQEPEVRSQKTAKKQRNGARETMRNGGEEGNGKTFLRFSDSPISRFIFFCVLLTVFAGCGISKDIYQKKVEESEARKASMEQAQEEINQLKQENQQMK